MSSKYKVGDRVRLTVSLQWSDPAHEVIPGALATVQEVLEQPYIWPYRIRLDTLLPKELNPQHPLVHELEIEPVS